VSDALFATSLALLVLVPLAFSTAVYTKYSLPKFVILLVGAATLLLFMAQRPALPGLKQLGAKPDLRFRLVSVVCLYFLAVAVSTLFGVAPVVSLFGTHFNHMGLITRGCFFIFFLALSAGLGATERRLRITLWVIAATGFVVATYAVAQSFGVEPFVRRSLYTFPTPEGSLIRVCASLGHADYLGNYLCYTTLLTVGLALAARGWLRLFAGAAAVLSIIAIAFSGTRGAWLGLIAGIAAFAFFELKDGAAFQVLKRSPRSAIIVAGVSAVLLVSLFLISPASRSVTHRLRELMSEGTSASGRNLLWRDSVKMVPSFALAGTGPEGFREALLGFKSIELAKLNPLSNNESSHNSYLDTLISQGVAGAALYISIIVLSLMLLIRARRHTDSQSWRFIVTGLLSSFIAVLVHNIFIYDQIVTGLYFFAFVAISVAMSKLVVASVAAGEASQRLSPPAKEKRAATKREGASAPLWKWPRVVQTAAALACILTAIWYSVGIIESDAAYNDLFDSSRPVDFNRLVSLGNTVTGGPDPTHQYDFLFAHAVETFVRNLPKVSESAARSQGITVDVKAIREDALKLAISHVEKSLARTLTPDLNYSLLGSLALAAGDVNKLQDAAGEAIRWDRYNYYARLLMAEAYLARGEKESAEREAELAFELRPLSQEVASMLARIRGASPTDDTAAVATMAEARNAQPNLKRDADDLVEIARKFAQQGKLRQAQIRLVTAIGRANGPCADCHRELANVYEKMGKNAEAISEWEKYLTEDPARASAEQIKARIEVLKQKSIPKH
jgi:O-antigen ligase/tetratricopeptide (TPR) repeat protein